MSWFDALCGLLVLQLREGREIRSKTINNNNNPEFDQTFRILVDDPESQVWQLATALSILFSRVTATIGRLAIQQHEHPAWVLMFRKHH